MLVLPWLNFHPGHTPRTSRRVGPRRTVDEIAKCCADLVAAGFIEPTTWH